MKRIVMVAALAAVPYRSIADGGDGLHTKHLDVEFELDDQAGRSSSFGSGSSPSDCGAPAPRSRPAPIRATA